MKLTARMTVVDAYTGRPARVAMEVTPAALLFSAPDATTPRRFYASMGEAVAALGSGLTCPYTGDRLRPVRDGDAVMFMGGWDPRRPLPRQEFLHYASMRAGKSDVPAGAVRIGSVEEPVPAPRSREKPVTQEAIDAMKELMEPKRTKRRRKG